MTATPITGFQKLIRVGMILAAAVAMLAWPAAWYLESRSIEVQQISAFDEAVVAANRATFEEGDSVAEIYGATIGEPLRVVFVDESRILRPEEDASLALYPKSSDENLLQVKAVYYVAKSVSVGAALGAVSLLGLLAFIKRRRGSAVSACVAA